MEQEEKKNQEKNNYQEKLAEVEESWKRALADYKNLERRVAQERADFVKFANATLLLKLFDVYDSIKSGLEHEKDSLQPIFEQLKKVLESEGLKMVEINKGDQFDASKMEVVEGSVGEVVSCVAQDGFELDGKIIRPARVELK